MNQTPASIPPAAEPLLRNLEQVRYGLQDRLLAPDFARLLGELGAKDVNTFVDAVFDRAAELWATVPAVDRVEPEFFAMTRACIKDNLGLYRIDERQKRHPFATAEQHNRVWQAFGAASKTQLVDAFIADLAAFQPKEKV